MADPHKETVREVCAEKKYLFLEACCAAGVTLGAVAGAYYTGHYLAWGVAAIFAVTTLSQMYDYLHYCMTHKVRGHVFSW